MPKNDKPKKDSANGVTDSTSAAATVNPSDIYFPPAQSPVAEVSGSPIPTPAVAVPPVTDRARRRLTPGVIIGISAASLGILAGVFVGGIAVGVTVGHRGPAGLNHQLRPVSGQLQNGNRPGGSFQGGPMQGGPMQGGQLPQGAAPSN